MMSNTSPDAPFGFVMLSTIKYGTAGTTYPRLRLHQTADYGYVPNPEMPYTFMATAVDTYDEENGIHPRYKKIVGERLAYAGLGVAYDLDGFPINGPIASEVAVKKLWTSSIQQICLYRIRNYESCKSYFFRAFT